MKDIGGRFFDTAVARVRLVTLLFGVLSVLSVGLQLNSKVEPAYRYLSLVGAAFLVICMLVTARLRRPVMIYDGPALAVGTILLGVGLSDPSATIGAIFGLLAATSMYGAARSMLVRTACLVICPSLAVAASPVPMSASAQLIAGGSFAILLFGALMWTLRVALEGQAFANAREKYLANLSQRLLGTTSYDQILRQLKAANMELVEMSPGLVVVPANVQRPSKRHPRGSAQIMGVAGAPTPPSRNLPTELILPLEKEDLDSFPPVPGGTAELMECGLPRRQWYAFGIDRETGDSLGINLMLYGVPMGFRSRFLGITGQPQTELMDAIKNTASLAMMAKRNTQMFLELTQQAHHDELTAMPNRSVLFSELDHAVRMAGPGDLIGSLIIDLDDFKRVNDIGGHAAGDALLVEVANRISEVVGSAGIAARFGGDEFAVLIPRLPDLGAAHSLAERILTRLADPIQLAGSPIRVAASVGVAITGDGITGADLVRCADMAMYSAKASGKGRIDIFSLDRHGSVARSQQLQEQIRRPAEPGQPAQPNQSAQPSQPAQPSQAAPVQASAEPF